MRALRFGLLAIVLTAGSAVAGGRTLCDDLGGVAGIERIAQIAVEIYLTDPMLAADFDNINPDRLRTRLSSQLCQMADGPCTYRGRTMADSHRDLGITQAKFNAVAEGLQTAMERAGIGYWTQNRLMARLAPLQRQIVTR